MKLTGPYLTLAGGLAAAGALFVLSNNAAGTDQQKQAAARASAVSNVTQPRADEPAATTKPPVKIVELVPAGSYAGPMKGKEAWIALAVKNDTAIAYVCDGSKVEAWMQGKAHAASLKMTGKNASTLTGKFARGRLSGTVKAEGQKWTFSVKQVQAPSGLYRSARSVRQAKVVSGWIVSGGKQVGMLNSSTAGESPAPRLDLTTGTAVVDDTEFRATLLDGSPIS